MMGLRPILLIGLLVAGSGVLVHLLGPAAENPAPAPQQRGGESPAAAKDPADPGAAKPPADQPPARSPDAGTPDAATEVAEAARPAVRAASGRAREPAREQDAGPARSRIEPPPVASRSSADQVAGRADPAPVQDRTQPPSAGRTAIAEPRPLVADAQAERARLGRDPAEEAGARDAGSGSTPPAVASPAHDAAGNAPEAGRAPAEAGATPATSGPGEEPPAVLADRPAPVADPAPRSGPPAREVGVPEERAGDDGAGRGWGDFGITMLRRSIDRLFGSWTGDEPADQPPRPAEPSDTPDEVGVAARDDAAGREESGPRQLTSKSEASIRQAVRAMVALEEIAPGAGPEPAAEEGEQGGDPSPPGFDIVRVEPGGSAVIAGRAEPGTEIEVRAGEEVIDRVKADRSGAWVSTPATPLAAGDQTLSLAALKDDGTVVRSEDVVVVAIRDSREPAAAVAPEPPPPQPPAQVVAEAPPPQPPEIVPAVAPAKPLAVLLPKRGEGRILQAPGRISSDGRLALNILDYDRSGRVALTGEAPPGAAVRIYVDNQPAAEVVAAETGAWSTALEDRLGPGTYTLRLDQLDRTGRPVARLETPFTRVERPPREGDLQVDYVIVQPGNSLWRIARRLSGRGMSYVHIFDANRGQIRDPDLIYPGQVFEVPAGFGSAG